MEFCSYMNAFLEQSEIRKLKILKIMQSNTISGSSSTDENIGGRLRMAKEFF